MTQQCISNRCLLEGDRNYMLCPLLAIVRFLIRKKNVWWRSGYIMHVVTCRCWDLIIECLELNLVYRRWVSWGVGGLRLRLVSSYLLCRCHIELLSLTSLLHGSVIDGVFASLVVCVWAWCDGRFCGIIRKEKDELVCVCACVLVARGR